jgi:peptide/nickel transport system ATP-binding protein
MAGRGTAHLGDPDDALLVIEDLHVRFSSGRGTVKAVTELSLDIRRGETLGLVGESGCGKSTTGRAIMQLPPPTSGRIVYDGVDLTELKGERLRALRTKLQMIFQDPISSLNPRRRVEDIVAEGLRIWKMGDTAAQEAKVDEVLEAVGLDPDRAKGRRPHQFSGGQCQRISIARAIVTEPDLIICDEPVSALDVSVQAQILNLLEDLKARYGLTMVFIAHDLAVVKNVSDRVAVMYLGRLCEVGPPDVLFSQPAHPYTEALLDAIPEPDPDHRGRERYTLSGELPSPIEPPSGCHFRTRCERADEVCSQVVPEMAPTGDGRFVACHHPLVETAVSVGTATSTA